MSEIRRGYKQTEVWLIPEDWEVKPLRQISRACREIARLPRG